MKKMRLRKSIIGVLLVAVMLCCTSVNIFAAVSNPSIEPMWDNISYIDLVMTFNNGTGTVTGTANKKADSHLIEGTLYLYKLVDGEWVYMDESYKSKLVGTLALGIEFVCESGVTYKGVFTVTAYTGGIGETETVEVVKVCP